LRVHFTFVYVGQGRAVDHYVWFHLGDNLAYRSLVSDIEGNRSAEGWRVFLVRREDLMPPLQPDLNKF
jgi:hypothetical protein